MGGLTTRLFVISFLQAAACKSTMIKRHVGRASEYVLPIIEYRGGY